MMSRNALLLVVIAGVAIHAGEVTTEIVAPGDEFERDAVDIEFFVVEGHFEYENEYEYD